MCCGRLLSHHVSACCSYGCPVGVAAPEATLSVIVIMLLFSYLVMQAISNPGLNPYKNQVYSWLNYINCLIM